MSYRKRLLGWLVKPLTLPDLAVLIPGLLCISLILMSLMGLSWRSLLISLAVAAVAYPIFPLLDKLARRRTRTPETTPHVTEANSPEPGKVEIVTQERLNLPLWFVVMIYAGAVGALVWITLWLI